MDSRLRQIAKDHGVFLTSEALDLGYDDRAIQRRRLTGEWHRVRRGAYTFGDIWKAADAIARHKILVRAAMRGARTEVHASHTSAVLEHGIPIWDLDLSEAHLTRTDGRAGRREARVRQHRGKLLDEDRTKVNGINVLSATRAVLEVTTLTDVEHSLVVANGALHLGRTSQQALEARLAKMDHWPHTLTTDLVLRLANGLIESVGESRSYFLFWRQGLPAPIPQYEIRDASGQVVARVDFAWPEFGVFLEFDGKSKYSTLLREGEEAADVVMREKRREELICRLTGWRCIRLVWADLYEPARTAERIKAVLHRAA